MNESKSDNELRDEFIDKALTKVRRNQAKSVDESPAPPETLCWLCDYESLKDKREKAMLLLFVAAMHSDNTKKTLCDLHRAAWIRMQSKYQKAVKQ